MATSVRTIVTVYRVLCKHLDKETVGKILEDLLKINANKSFKKTIDGLWHIHTQWNPNDHSREV